MAGSSTGEAIAKRIADELVVADERVQDAENLDKQYAAHAAKITTDARNVQKEKLKEILSDNAGCQYLSNLGVDGNEEAFRPPASTVAGSSTASSASSWIASANRTSVGTSGAPGTAPAGIRNKVLPVSAPAFVPAAVAAAQRAALTAWGGVTPGGGKLLNGVGAQASFGSGSNSGSGTGLQTSSASTAGPAATETSSAASQASPVRTSGVANDATGSTPIQDLGSGVHPARQPAQPFPPANSVVTSPPANGSTSTISSSSSTSSIGSANAAPYVPSAAVASAVTAAPYVPKSKQQQLGGPGGMAGPSAGLGFGPGGGRPLPMGHSQGSVQQLQIRQQLSQLQQQMQQQAAVHMLARGMPGNGMSSPYLNLDIPMVMPPFRLPDGDDPALGMTAMSPPNHAFAIPLTRAGNGGMPVLPSPEALASMGMVGDSGGLQAGNGFGFPLTFGPNFQAQSVRNLQQQQIQQLQKLQSQHHGPLQPPNQMHPYSMRSPQKMDGQKQYEQTPEKSLASGVPLDSASTVNNSRNLSSHIFSGELQAKDHAGPAAEQEQQHLSVREASFQQQQPHQPLSQHQHQQHQQHPQQSPSQQQQPGLKQQRQQQSPKLHHQQQIHILQQRPQAPQGPLASSAQQQQLRHPAAYFRPMPPVSTVAPVAAATHGGATYYLSPGQGIGSLQHVVSTGPYNASGARADAQAVRGHSPVGRVHLGSRFLPDNLREELRRRHALTQAQLDPEQDLVDLPEMVQRYHSLYPLEDVNKEDEAPSASFGVRSMIFKGISSSDGQAYAIRRIDSRQVIPTPEVAAAAVEAVERWSTLARHPHIVAVRESFVNREIEDSAALFFVYDYYPAAVTLEFLHLRQEQPVGVVHLTVGEEQLWSYVVQLATVIRSVHAAGLFFRPGGLHPSKILVPSKGRLRVNAAAILDVLNGDPADDIRVMQREDLAGFGRLILCMACASTVNPSVEFMAAHYTQDLVRITQALLGSSPEKAEGLGISNIRQLYTVLGDHMLGEIEHLHVQNDELMAYLGKETENGRLLRILIKLGLMNERPDDDMDPNWSETGDRYLLKLFRDFVFHQMTDEGAPLIDWGHVIESLNKLDAGVSEKLILLSRDERSMLIASYADLKRCLEGAYQELTARASGDKPRAPLSQSALSVAQSPSGHPSRANQRQTS